MLHHGVETEFKKINRFLFIFKLNCGYDFLCSYFYYEFLLFMILRFILQKMQKALKAFHHHDALLQLLREVPTEERARAFLQTTNVSALHFNYTFCNSGWVLAFLNALGPSQLTVLNLAGITLCGNGVYQLVRLIHGKTTTTLQQLGLKAALHFVAPNDVHKLFAALKYNHTLHVLDIQCNQLHSHAGVALADVLRNNNCKLQELYMGENCMREGAVEIANALHTNTTLRVLAIDNNGLQNIGGQAFIALLQKNQTLQYLSLAWNTIGESLHLPLIHALEQNKAVTTLMVDGNCFSWALVAQFQHLPALKRNRTLFWTPHQHALFSSECHAAMLTILMAQPRSALLLPTLPDELWRTIFAYWRRNDYPVSCLKCFTSYL